jgi:hypothetical protein
MSIFPVTCRFGTGARLTLELIIGPVRAKSPPEFGGFLPQYFTFFSPRSGRMTKILDLFGVSGGHGLPGGSVHERVTSG